MTWRNCGASLALLGEVNAKWPGRDRSSDGTIGDAAHAARTSDHNPWVIVAGQGVVRARDIDVDGIDAAWLAEYLRQLGAKRDRRLYPGGYVIFNERITAPDFSGWRTYTGTNPHTKHVHVSFTTNPAGFDDPGAWGISAAAPTIPALPEVPMTAKEFWDYPAIPDYYKDPKGAATFPAFAALGWAATHAAYARGNSGSCLEEVRALRQEVAALRAQAPTLPALDYDQLAAALLRGMAARPA